MPTYTHRCEACGSLCEPIMSIHEYVTNPPALVCCGQLMVRHITVAPGLAKHTHTSDAIYDGLRATDGTDISTRAKHRAYMKARNLTTVDDFKDTWAQQAREREQRLAGVDRARAQDIANAIHQLEQKGST